MSYEHQPKPNPDEIAPGHRAIYLPTGKVVTVFGREREKPDLISPVLYYWVECDGRRFKATRNELRK